MQWILIMWMATCCSPLLPPPWRSCSLTTRQNNENGLQLTLQDSLDYLHFLSAKARSLRLAIGLKNAGGLVNGTLDVMSFSVNEQASSRTRSLEAEELMFD